MTLELKFGKEGLQLLSEIEKRADVGLLETLMDAIKRGATADDLRRVYADS